MRGGRDASSFTLKMARKQSNVFGTRGRQRRSPDLDHGLSGLHEAADVLADLSVRLGRLSEVVPHLLAGLVQGPPLVRTHPPHCTATGRGRQLLVLCRDGLKHFLKKKKKTKH